MIKAIVLGTSAYVRDCRHDKEYKQKKWLWRIFRVRDDSFDYRTWKRGNWWVYVRRRLEIERHKMMRGDK